MMNTRLLFNFSASYSGGGFKRLYEYAKWFDAAGGACFLIHPNCARLIDEFPANRFFVVKVSRLRRLVSDCGYLADIGRQIGRPDLYYSYGIPLYFRFGRVNWFHLSNVLPLAPQGIPMSLYDRLRNRGLGHRIRRGFAWCEVLSAESAYSLDLLDVSERLRLFHSVNGSDDELRYIREPSSQGKESYATVVGTLGHKAIADSYRVFQMLQARSPELKLVIIGVPQAVPADIGSKPEVLVRGVLSRPEVIAWLRRSRYYISTTLIENSYNAASEGIFLASESYISDIGPHRELLQGSRWEEVAVAGLNRPLLHVRCDDLSAGNLKTWDTVVREMIGKFQQVLNHHE